MDEWGFLSLKCEWVGEEKAFFAERNGFVQVDPLITGAEASPVWRFCVCMEE
jgi:hypothetical protein